MINIYKKGSKFIACTDTSGKEIRSEFDDILDAAKWIKNIESEDEKDEKNTDHNSNDCCGASDCRESA